MSHSLRRTFAAALLSTAAAASPLAAQQQQPSVSLGGVVYAQWGAQMDSLSPANNFDVTRAYLNAIGRFNGGILTRITADVYHDGDATAGGGLNYRLKYAYFGWNPTGSPLTFRFGLTQTPFLDWEEALWDYRMQGPMMVDRNGYMSSSDFGLAVDGNVNSELVDFQAMAFNGENYNKAPGDRHKDFAARVSVRVMGTDDGSRVGGLRITGYAQAGTPTSGGTRSRFIGMLSYRSKALTLAGEYLSATDTVTAPATGKHTGTGISVFGVFHVPASQLSVIARADIVDPNTANNTTATSNDKRTTLILGLSYQLSPNVRLLADLDNTSLQGSTVGSATAPKKVTQALFQTQFTF